MSYSHVPDCFPPRINSQKWNCSPFLTFGFHTAELPSTKCDNSSCYQQPVKVVQPSGAAPEHTPSGVYLPTLSSSDPKDALRWPYFANTGSFLGPEL